MLSRAPGREKEVTPEILEMVKCEVSAQMAVLQEELAALRESMDTLLEERPGAKGEEGKELTELKSSVKRELHEVQQVRALKS